MACHGFIESASQDGDVEARREMHGDGEIVNRASGFQLLHEPEPLLGEGERRGFL